MTKKYYYIILFLVCVIVYFNAIPGEFVGDDIAIGKNPQIIKLYPDPMALLNHLTWRLFDINPIPYHVAGILLHSIATILLFIVLMKIFSVMASFFGALLFAVHPIHAEAVTWVSGHSQIIFGITFLGLLLLLHKRTRLRYLISFLIFLVMSIHNYYWMLPIGLTLVVTQIIFNRKLKDVLMAVSFLAIPFLFHFSKQVEIAGRLSAIAPIVKTAGITPVNFLPYKFAMAVCNYFLLYIFPCKLTPYHEPIIMSDMMIILQTVIVGYTLFLMVCFYKKIKLLVWAFLIFVIMLMFSYAPIQIAFFIAERYMYIPSIGFSVALCWVWDRWGEKDETS